MNSQQMNKVAVFTYKCINCSCKKYYNSVSNSRRIYWSDWGTVAKIEQASMDGRFRSVIHNTDLTWPNALTLDYDTQTLYWMDAYLDKLESSNVNGLNRRLLSRAYIYHPFGITLFRGRLYWTDWQVNAVLSAHLNQPQNVSLVMGPLVLDPLGIHVISLERQPRGQC